MTAIDSPTFYLLVALCTTLQSVDLLKAEVDQNILFLIEVTAEVDQNVLFLIEVTAVFMLKNLLPHSTLPAMNTYHIAFAAF